MRPARYLEREKARGPSGHVPKWSNAAQKVSLSRSGGRIEIVTTLRSKVASALRVWSVDFGVVPENYKLLRALSIFPTANGQDRVVSAEPERVVQRQTDVV